MKTAYFVPGIILLVLGIGLGILAVSWLGVDCAEDPFTARLFGLPTCGQLQTQIFAVGGGGLLFLIIGAVLLQKGIQGGVP